MVDASREEVLSECFNESDKLKLIKLIASGRAILFAGAGFSTGAINIADDEIPISKKLADKIDKVTANDSHQNLMVASEEAIDNNMGDKLIELLKEIFTIKQTCQHHETIIGLPWRRYYTTNYDAVIRQAGLKNSKNIKCITTSDSVEKNLNEKNLCVHINGRIEELDSETLNTSFKLSDSSYLDKDALNDTQWGDVFQRELFNSSAIVFIGYSLYDYTIKRLLFNYKEELRDKIYFITREKPCTELKTEQKFGKVINIGIEKFADYIQLNKGIIEEYSKVEDITYESFKKYSLGNGLYDVTHDAIRDFLIYGKYEKGYIEQAIKEPNKNQHLIVFMWILECLELIRNHQYVHVSGDLGFGKSIGLEIMSSMLSNDGENVFILHDRYGDYIGDISKIVEKYAKKVYIFIDNAEQNREIIQHIYELNNPRIHCISASRKNLASLLSGDVSSRTKNFIIDRMKDPDIEQLIKIVENIGATGFHSTRGIKSLIEDECENALPNFLLKFLLSDKIGNLIKDDFYGLDSIDGNKYRTTLVALCLLGILNRELSFSTIATLTNNSNIRDGKLLDNQIFKNFFTISDGKLKSRSSIFAIHILRHYYFVDSIKKDIFLKFAVIANEHKQHQVSNDKIMAYEFESIFKELVKFVSLSKLFTKDNYDIILRYFEGLKTELDWIKNDPNYWLQLAILNLARGKFDIAKQEIDTARNKAQSKKEYQSDYIDTVEARYNLDLALKSSTTLQDCYELFFTADTLLRNTNASDQKYRQISRYIDVYKKINHSVSKDKLGTFLQCINAQLGIFQRLADSHYQGIDRLYLAHNCEASLNKILTDARIR